MMPFTFPEEASRMDGWTRKTREGAELLVEGCIVDGKGTMVGVPVGELVAGGALVGVIVGLLVGASVIGVSQMGFPSSLQVVPVIPVLAQSSSR